MVRMSDIIKRRGRKEKVEEKREPLVKEKREPLIKEEVKEKERIKPSEFPKEVRAIAQDIEEAKGFYIEAVYFMRSLWDDLEKKQPLNAYAIKNMVNRLLDAFFKNSETTFYLAASHFLDNNYLPVHSVNVCLYAISIGSELGYDRERLTNLAIAALLHDVGMSRVPKEIFLKSGSPSGEEWAEIKKHPIEGYKILKAVKDFHQDIALSTYQQHERELGQGYPKGLKDEKIHEFAKIIGLVDAYEAMTHPRIYQEARSPHEAIKELLTMNGGFTKRVLKMLIVQFTVYPIGTVVQLNTGEVGEVKMVNKDFSTRPTVEIILDSEGQRLKESKRIDLYKQQAVFVQKVLSKDELRSKLNKD